MVGTIAIEGVIPLLGGPFCTHLNLERVGVDLLLTWESRSMR
jgi:hypothetical protein